MTLKLTLFSQEKDDFVREILIDSDAKFAELHQLILTDCSYDEHQKQCFLICDGPTPALATSSKMRDSAWHTSSILMASVSS